MCHNYLGAQFLSPLFNHRTDEYGIDTLENQHFVSQWRRCISCGEALGDDMILAVKLQGFDGQEGGHYPELAASFAPYIEKQVQI